MQKPRHHIRGDVEIDERMKYIHKWDEQKKIYTLQFLMRTREDATKKPLPPLPNKPTVFDTIGVRF